MSEKTRALSDDEIVRITIDAIRLGGGFGSAPEVLKEGLARLSEDNIIRLSAEIVALQTANDLDSRVAVYYLTHFLRVSGFDAVTGPTIAAIWQLSHPDKEVFR